MHSCYVWDHKSLKEEDMITHKTHFEFLCHTSKVMAYQCNPVSRSAFGTTKEHKQFRWESERNYLLSTSLEWQIPISLICLVSPGLPLKLNKVPKSLRLWFFAFFNLKLVNSHKQHNYVGYYERNTACILMLLLHVLWNGNKHWYFDNLVSF